MKIDYNKLDAGCRKTIENIEKKPHIKYIRYLLTKGYSPRQIKTELQRLGLSSPHEKPLSAYYLSVIDPVARHFGVSYLYSDYKSRLLRSDNKPRDFAKNILNYRLTLGGDLDGQVKFCKFIKALEIDSMWCSEIYTYHGSALTMPIDENGNRIIKTTTSTRGPSSAEKILLFDKRYLIDKMLLESVPMDRITKYCRESLKLSVTEHDIILYKTMFFNIQTQTIEEKIKALEVEKNSLKLLLSDMDSGAGEYAELTIGERCSLKESTNRRIEELTDNIKGLNMLYTDAAATVARVNNMSFESMFTDIVGRAYKRFTELDGCKDRDVVDPLFKTARMMTFAHDKIEQIKAISPGNAADKHSQSVLLSLYQNRVDEIIDEQKQRVSVETGDENFGNVNLEEIGGVEELGISFDTENSED